MHLSRIQLNTQRRRTRWLLASPQRLHAEVLNAFPDPPTGDRSGGPRILWRLDEEGRRTLLYVVSPEPPDLSKLTEEAGWNTAPGEVRGYGPLLDRIRDGSRWAFRLTANPVRYVKGPDDKRGQRSAHVTVGYQELWLEEQAARNGFTVHGARGDRAFALTDRRSVRFTRGKSAQPVTIAVAQFDGELTVADAEKFRGALVAGVGPAKAYGCGLLTVAPIRQ